MTVTTPEMTRFLLSLDEAVDTVFAALRDGAAGRDLHPARAVGADGRRRRGADRRPRDRDRVHRHPAGREDPRGPGLRGGGAADRTSAASTCAIAAHAARAAAREKSDGEPFEGREYSSADESSAPTASRAARAHGCSRTLSRSPRDEGPDRPRDPARDHPAVSRLIERLDRLCDQSLVHTGQNFDPSLSDVFFEELGVRAARSLPRDRGRRVRGTGWGGSSPASSRVLVEPSPTGCWSWATPTAALSAYRREAAGHPGVPHGGRQPLLRRPGARGGQPAGDRPLERRPACRTPSAAGRTCCARASTRAGSWSPATRSRR